MNTGTLALLLLVTIFRGSSSFKSPIGITKCNYGDILLVIIYVVSSVAVTVLAILIQRREYFLKLKY